MTHKRILVVEDDAILARVLRDNLTFEGFEVSCAADGRVALTVARDFAPDLILLDIMLPGKDGFELCRVWRQQRTPIIMITARGQKEDKIRGLSAGADDYVTKPFELEELLARIHAVLRRARPSIESLELGSVKIDFIKLQAWKHNRPLELTHREFELLRYLAERPDRVVHREELLREVWGHLETLNTRAVDHAVARLRKKIEVDAHQPEFIHTVYADGYCLTPRPPADPDSKRR
jgi:DNA-binding response OmpR family regulator